LFAYAVLENNPDGSLLDLLISCLVEREDTPAGWTIGLRALQSIARGHPPDRDQLARRVSLRLRPLPVQARNVLEALINTPVVAAKRKAAAKGKAAAKKRSGPVRIRQHLQARANLALLFLPRSQRCVSYRTFVGCGITEAKWKTHRPTTSPVHFISRLVNFDPAGGVPEYATFIGPCYFAHGRRVAADVSNLQFHGN
jgi:hypothetical protein